MHMGYTARSCRKKPKSKYSNESFSEASILTSKVKGNLMEFGHIFYIIDSGYVG